MVLPWEMVLAGSLSRCFYVSLCSLLCQSWKSHALAFPLALTSLVHIR